MTLRVLLVDDDAMSLALCRLAMAELDERVQVDVARDGREAIRRLDGEGYDVVIADWRMPDVSGVEVLEAARRALPDAMRVLTSGTDDPDGAREAMRRASIHAFLPKSPDFAALRADLEGLLQARRMARP